MDIIYECADVIAPLGANIVILKMLLSEKKFSDRIWALLPALGIVACVGVAAVKVVKLFC